MKRRFFPQVIITRILLSSHSAQTLIRACVFFRDSLRPANTSRDDSASLPSIVVSMQRSLLFANASPERVMVPALLDVGLLCLSDNLAYRATDLRGERGFPDTNRPLPHKYCICDVGSLLARLKVAFTKNSSIQVSYYIRNSHISLCRCRTHGEHSERKID